MIGSHGANLLVIAAELGMSMGLLKWPLIPVERRVRLIDDCRIAIVEVGFLFTSRIDNRYSTIINQVRLLLA